MAEKKRILLVEDTASLRDVLRTVLETEQFSVTVAESAEAALVLAREEGPFDLVLSDLKLPGQSGLDLLQQLKSLVSSTPVVIMTAYGNIDVAVQAMKFGATDFITKPFDPTSLISLLSQVIERGRVIYRCPSSNNSFMTQSPKVEHILKQARKVAPLGSPVLILGESGTGKELLARYIHDHGIKSAEERPFIGVNCGSLPQELLESEFFGHEQGAFTGATALRLGLFEVANGGTIFLDEIGNMPLSLQVKLLRALQESEIRRIGGVKNIKVDVRVISATNANLVDDIKAKRFREDLYYRLGVIILEIPPIRERKEDIPLLAKYFVRRFANDFKIQSPHLTQEALAVLAKYDWPGNVREIENVIQRALIFSNGRIEPKHLELGGELETVKPLLQVAAEAAKLAEISAIKETLLRTGGNKLQAAKLLGVSYKTLLSKVKEFELNET